jgi:acyl-CoA dehydrogenase
MLNRYLTAELQALRERMDRFVSEKMAPQADAWEREETFPRELFREIGDQGFFGLKFGPVYGGPPEKGYLAAALWMEALSGCGSGGVAGSLAAHSEIALPPLFKFGSEIQQKRWLLPGVKGEKIAALAITEPDAGSDVGSIRCRAERDGAFYRLSGSKMFITNGVRADFVVLAAKTDPQAQQRGISLFIVERETPGFSVGRKLDKLGWRPSDTAELVLDGCLIPKENLIGQENQGFYAIMENFQWERLALALGSISASTHLLELAATHLRERKQFGRTLSGFQALRHRFADMLTHLEAARQLAYSALIRLDQGENVVPQATMAKLFACEASHRIIDGCLQMFGSRGILMDHPVQRVWRDERLNSIGGGTSEVMREILGRLYLG